MLQCVALFAKRTGRGAGNHLGRLGCAADGSVSGILEGWQDAPPSSPLSSTAITLPGPKLAHAGMYIPLRPSIQCLHQ